MCGPHPAEDAIDALWPREAPPTVKAAVAGLYLMIVLLVANIVAVAALAPRGEVFLEDVVIGAVFVGVIVGLSRRALWARYAGVAVAALFAFASISLFRSGVPGIAVAVGVLQLVVLLGVVVLLLLRPSGEWFRGLV